MRTHLLILSALVLTACDIDVQFDPPAPIEEIAGSEGVETPSPLVESPVAEATDEAAEADEEANFDPGVVRDLPSDLAPLYRPEDNVHWSGLEVAKGPGPDRRGRRR